MASIDAAARINAIIDRVANLADAQTANAGGYANNAANAADGIHINTDEADVPPSSASISPFNAQPLPPIGFIDGTGGLAESISEIQSGLETKLFEFFGTYFAGSDVQQMNAIQTLQGIVNNAQGIFNTLSVRSHGDTQARGYLNDSLTHSVRALTRIDDAIGGGADGTGFMRDRIATIAPATRYLLTKFAQGDQATTTLMTMMTSGTGLPPGIEAQIWNRDRARLMAEGVRARTTAIAQWSARGYPMPPGAAMAAVEEIDARTQDGIAQSSRERAIKSIDVLLENLRFAAERALADARESAVRLDAAGNESAKALIDDARAATQLTLENARQAAVALLQDALESARSALGEATRGVQTLVELRTKGINASVDYIRALAIGPQVAADIVRARVEAQSTMRRVLVDYYRAGVEAQIAQTNAQVAVAELQLKPAIVTSQNRAQLIGEQNRALVGIGQIKVNAAIAACEAVARMAASALSTLNTVTAFSQNA